MLRQAGEPAQLWDEDLCWKEPAWVTQSLASTSFCVSPDQVFGCQLESLCQREGDTVPSFVRLCVAAVDKRGHFPRVSSF